MSPGTRKERFASLRDGPRPLFTEPVRRGSRTCLNLQTQNTRNRSHTTPGPTRPKSPRLIRPKTILTPQSIVLRSASDGLFSVPQRPCIVIPSHARRPHGIKPGDHVLIAAAPAHGLVIVYPLSALDEMISRYHSA
jgi:hypothetical protein